MESKKKVACDAPTPSGIYVIEVNTVSYGNLWVLDTGCGSHICTDMQGLRDSKKLIKGEFDLRVGNGARVAAVAIGTYVLNLPSGFCLYLDYCFCVPTLTKNIIYVSCLNKKGFRLKFCDNSCCIMLNDVFYAGGTLSNGIYILQHNGVVERRNLTFLDMVRSMMGKADLPKSFWGYALETVVYILHKVPSKSVEVTPYEIWTNKKPYLSHIKVWGCPAYVKRTISDKLEAKSNKCLFVGYPKETMGYQFYNTLEQRLFVSKHVVFLEKEFLLREDNGSKVELSEVQDALTYAAHLTEPKVVIHDDELIADSSKTQVFRRTSRMRSISKRWISH